MMKMRARTSGMMNSGAGARGSPVGSGKRVGNEWEVRPGGMVVQRRTDQSSGEPPAIRIRVKYGSVYHEISINFQATFGELKKLLSGPTGLHHQDMKIMYKDKERDSKAFLDVSGVKENSKMILLEDPIAQEKRLVEMRKTAMFEKASKRISEISLEVDRLAGQVSAFETVISKGGRVEEKTLENVIEMLMNQLLKLDAITADGDVKLQRKMQVRRVQNYVETLDALKIKNNSTVKSNNGLRFGSNSSGQKHEVIQEQQSRNFSNNPYRCNIQEQLDLLSYDQSRNSSSSSSSARQSAVSTKRETIDSNVAAKNYPIPPRFKWELFE